MRKLTILTFFSLFLINNSYNQERFTQDLPAADPGQFKYSFSIPDHNMEHDSLIDRVIDSINLDSLVSYVRILSGEDSVWINDTKVRIEHRVNDSGNDLAADYIKNHLYQYDLEVEVQDVSTNGKNIIAVQPGWFYPDKQYIICAHYDAVTDYGADDNASGIATVMEAARILSNYSLKYTLIYALWDEEEYGVQGSNFYASEARSSQTEIMGVLNMDMIAWDSNNDGLMDIHTRDIANSNNLAERLVIINSLYELNLNPVIVNPGTDRSDHSSFWNYNYGAVLIIEAYYGGDLNPNYHSMDDRIEKFNLNYFHNMSKLTIGSIASFVEVVEDTLIIDVNPDRGFHTYDSDLLIKGIHTSFIKDTDTPKVWLSNEHNSIYSDSVKVLSNTSLHAYFKIPRTALTGLWDVNVQTSLDGVLQKVKCFEISPSPPLISCPADTIELYIEPGSTANYPLTISNDGGSILCYNISCENQNYAFQFDGIDDEVIIGLNPIFDIYGDITISVWYKTFSKRSGALVSNYSTTSPRNGYSLNNSSSGINGGILYFVCSMNNLNDAIYTNSTFDDGEWHFINAIYTPDGISRGKVFVDGIEQEGYNSGSRGLHEIGATPDSPLVIGSLNNENFFNGLIDEVRIWDKALTPDEIQNNMNAQLKGSEPGLIGYWDFNELDSDSTFDLTKNANNGFLKGEVTRVSGRKSSDQDWFFIDQDSGVCNQGSAKNLMIHFETRKLDPGEFLGLITIESNDPFNPIIKIPVRLHVEKGTGIKNFTGDQIDFSIYPNPTNGIFNIDTGSNPNYSVSINSPNGQLIYHHEVCDSNHQIDLSSFKTGIYFITIRTKSSTIIEKIIKL